MPFIYFESCIESVVEINNERYILNKGSSVMYASSVPSINVIKQFPLCDRIDITEHAELVYFPKICAVELTERAVGGGHYITRTRGCAAVDWGSIIEVKMFPRFYKMEISFMPVLLDEIDFIYKGAASTASLYLDNGIKLAIKQKGRGEPLYFALGPGFGGKLEKTASGNKNRLTISIDDADSRGVAFKRTLFIDENAQVLNENTSYEAVNGSGGQREAALSIVRNIGLGNMKEARECLSKELSDALDDDSIREFLGPFASAALMPRLDEITNDGYEDENKTADVTVGLFDINIDEQEAGVIFPRKYVIRMIGNTVSDIVAVEEQNHAMN